MHLDFLSVFEECHNFSKIEQDGSRASGRGGFLNIIFPHNANIVRIFGISVRIFGHIDDLLNQHTRYMIVVAIFIDRGNCRGARGAFRDCG